VRNSTARRSPLLLIEGSDGTADRLEPIRQESAAAGFDVVRANTLAEASSCLEGDLFECVVLDLDAEDEEDVGIIEAIASGSPGVALIVLGPEHDGLGVSMIEAGASDYLPRNSLGGQQLRRSIQHAIVRKRSETSFAEAQSIARLGSWEVKIATGTVTWSHELYRLFGFPSSATPSYEALVDRTHPDDRAATLQAHRVAMEDFSPFVVEHRILLPDGSLRWVRAQGRVELDATGRPARLVGTTQDITEQKNAEAALQYQALHQPLTGLPNRLLLIDRLGRALNRLARNASTVAVIHFDMDRLQLINESLGHQTGDQLLLAMAARLAELVRPVDTLAHVGSDEFVVVCEGLTGEAEAAGVADRIITAASEPLGWDGGELVVSLSAGIAFTTSGKESPDSLLRDADAAMHRAKRDGRARSAVFVERMRASVAGRLDTEMSLRQSIIDGELRVHYQPIVTLADGRVRGHEALVRWAHPTRGLLAPDQFISIAEETGLIVALGAWVLRESCQQAKRFQARDPSWSHLTVSVNLSGGQLNQPDLVELVASALRDADLSPEDLQLEMTESILMDDASTTITILERLKGLGIRLGIDDFGTGYSSLSYLRRFPVDVLKIDKSFVSGLGQDPQDSAIVAAVVSLADTLGLTTIAEGVETSLQRDCLVGLGCSLAQGYLFARPVPAEDREAELDQVLPAMS
jgi:diguanylate cyclase (GGDEF)-like protein/PAS domain S-box-containing protein